MRIAFVFGVLLVVVASAVVLFPDRKFASTQAGATQTASHPAPGGSPSQVRPPTPPVSPCQQRGPFDDPLVHAQRAAKKQQNEISELRHLLTVHEIEDRRRR